ncbi:hypothetical protein BVG16_01025 [Paenibacillus selenitireducens]|uniref:Uncharacterized protein n=1 Tax=Paenibacillus selenitireducens TaxID=1324314 RepID=A0A1T2XM85_9BACL|nr:hypothetical protein [Paenibacillus selenitireducens]OPA80961.1 hypothetical protein BVG16_01025 [Paenibacillus selenitireducens]
MVNGFGITEDYRRLDYLSVYIRTPKLDRYTLILSRARDSFTVNRDYGLDETLSSKAAEKLYLLSD